MFKCQNQECVLPHHQVQRRQPMHQVTVEKRPKHYEKHIYNKRGQIQDTVTIDGWEIIKQIAVCPDCFQSLTGLQPKVADPEPPKPKRSFKPRQETPRRKWRNPKATTTSPQKKSRVVVEKVNTVVRKHSK